jgi:hypothetical protein
MKSEIKNLGLTAYKLVFCVSIMSLALFSCNNDYDPISNSEIDVTRKVFASQSEFETFLGVEKSPEAIYSPSSYQPDQELSIIESFKEFTTIGSILNDNLEFQVENRIYKYGESGYTTYFIQISKYNEALKYIAKEKNIIDNLDLYEILPNGNYKIEDGVEVFYNGEPIITVEKQKPPLLRISADGRTKVQTSFWSSKNPLKSECGVQVEAWSRPNESVDWESANTDLRLGWDCGLVIPMVPALHPFSGATVGTGNKIKLTLDWVIGYFSYKMEKGIVSGSARCWDNTWITAVVQK